MLELLDVYTADRKRTGRIISRGGEVSEGEHLLVVHVGVMNERQELLIQRRQLNKERYPGCWDLSAGGFVQSGERSPEAALRELREEVGLSVSSDALQFLFTEPFSYVLEVGLSVSSDALQFLFTEPFSYVLDDFYLVRCSMPLSAFTMQPEEVSELRWASRAEVEAMVTDGRFVDYPLSCIGQTYDLASSL